MMEDVSKIWKCRQNMEAGAKEAEANVCKQKNFVYNAVYTICLHLNA